MTALSRAAPAAPPFDRTAAASFVSPVIPRCSKAAISRRRIIEVPQRCQRPMAVEWSSTTSTSTSQPQHPLDAEASELRRALSNRASSDPQLIERSRDLALSLAAARRASSAEAASFLDALAGAVARRLESSTSSSSASISSLEASAKLTKAYAQSQHRTLATSELARSTVKQACRALTASSSPSFSPSLSSSAAATAGGGQQQPPQKPLPPPPLPPPPVRVFAAAASIARSVSCLEIYPGARLMEALSSSAVAFAVRSSGSTMTTADSDSESCGCGGGSSSSTNLRLPPRLPASAVVDWLCAAAAARHALPRTVSALAATARFNPIQAATAASALAILGDTSSFSYPPPPSRSAPRPVPLFPALISTLRSRVAGSPRGGVPARAAAAAAWALACWGELDAPSAAALAEHAEAGVAGTSAVGASGSESPPNPSLLREDDLVSLWGALRVAGWRAEETAEAEATFVMPAAPAAKASVVVSARAARAAASARAAALSTAADSTARGTPRAIARFLERLLQRGRGENGSSLEARALAPSADDCLLWRVEARSDASVVALVALSPRNNASSNSPVVSLGLASVELNAAAAAAPWRSGGEGGSGSRSESGDAAPAVLPFRGLLFDGDDDDRLEELAAAVEKALVTLDDHGPR